MMLNKAIVCAALLTALSAGPALADKGGHERNKHGSNECPVGLVSGMSLDDEFGPGTAEITHCLQRRHKVKLVVQINQLCGGTNAAGECVRPFALGNIVNVIDDYEITNGMQRGRDYEIAAIVHSGGGVLVLDPEAANPHPRSFANQWKGLVQSLMDKGVKFYFCQNTTRGMGVTTDQVIPGVEYVTAGISSLADFQARGWTYVQP